MGSKGRTKCALHEIYIKFDDSKPREKIKAEISFTSKKVFHLEELNLYQENH